MHHRQCRKEYSVWIVPAFLPVFSFPEYIRKKAKFPIRESGIYSCLIVLLLAAGQYQPSTFVVPPFSINKSTGVFAFHEPRVKSGTTTGFDLCATDHSLRGAMELQRAASYTS